MQLDDIDGFAIARVVLVYVLIAYIKNKLDADVVLGYLAFSLRDLL